MFCLQCGKEIPDNSTVCQFCGAIQPQAQQAAPQQAPYDAPQQAPYGAPQQAPYGAPQQAPYGAPQQTPYGAPQQTPYGAPQQQSFPSFAPPTPTKKKSKAPMIIGIVVGVILLLAIIGAIAGSGDSSSDGGNAPVESYGDYDVSLDDAVKALEKHSFKIEQNGITVVHTYYCNGDKIINWVQTSSMSIAGLTQEEIDTTIEACDNEYVSNYATYSFISHETEIDGDKLVEIYSFDNISDHVQDLEDLGLLTGDNVITLYVSLSQSRTQLLAQGFVEVE